MGNLFSPTHLLIILLIVLILFGRGKISEFMGDFAKGIKSFKKGLSEEEEQVQKPHGRLGGDNNAAAMHNHEEKQQKPADRDSH